MISDDLIAQLLDAERQGLLAQVVQNKPRGYAVEIQLRFKTTTTICTILRIEQHIKSKYGYRTRRFSELRETLEPIQYMIVSTNTL